MYEAEHYLYIERGGGGCLVEGEGRRDGDAVVEGCQGLATSFLQGFRYYCTYT